MLEVERGTKAELGEARNRFEECGLYSNYANQHLILTG